MGCDSLIQLHTPCDLHVEEVSAKSNSLPYRISCHKIYIIMANILQTVLVPECQGYLKFDNTISLNII